MITKSALAMARPPMRSAPPSVSTIDHGAAVLALRSWPGRSWKFGAWNRSMPSGLPGSSPQAVSGRLGSESTSETRSPVSARPRANSRAEVVLPTPPLELTKAMVGTDAPSDPKTILISSAA